MFAKFLPPGDVNSMKKELIAAHLTLGFAAHTGLTFRQALYYKTERKVN
jgi:hypothetical protein